MNKLVYLFELDSVRTTPEEIQIGQKALFQELIHNGNQVALTFNQLTDSKAFLYLLEEERTAKELLKIFEKGAIKLVRYFDTSDSEKIEIRTPAQFVMRALKQNSNDETFVFSALPIKKNNLALKDKLKQSIAYSDLSIIDDLLKKRRSYDNGGTNEQYNECISNGIIDTTLEELRFIRRFVDLILKLSILSLPYTETKPIISTGGILGRKSFYEYIEFSYDMSEYQLDSVVPKVLYQKAISHLKWIEGQIQGKNLEKRSTWRQDRYFVANSDEQNLAKIIIDLCYNFTVEDSIQNVSRHYDSNLEVGDTSFRAAFRKRLEYEWNCFNIVRNKKKQVRTVFPMWSTFVKWNAGARIIDMNYRFCHGKPSGKRYESAYIRERRQWRLKQICGFAAEAAIIIGCIVGFFLVNILTEVYISPFLDSTFGINIVNGNETATMLINICITTMVYSVIFEPIKKQMEKKVPALVLPDISKSFWRIICDFIALLFVLFTTRRASYIDRKGIRE